LAEDCLFVCLGFNGTFSREFLNVSARLYLFASLRNVSFAANMVILHEFDENVAVVATTVASITTGIVQFQTK